MKTVTRRSSTQSPMAGLFAQFLILKKEESEAKKAHTKIRDDLVEFTLKHHTEDPEMGHQIHTLPEPVSVFGQRYSGFMRQRKTSTVFLADKAQELCEAKGFDEDEYTSRYVDQDKIVRLYAEERITDEEFDSLSEINESWAFVPVKD